MKKIFTILSASLLIFSVTSCEKFFTREPINSFSAETYFSSEAELQMYANGMINSYLPLGDDGPLGGDAYNDLVATKTSTDFFRADVIWDNVKQGSWSWGYLRRVNYMLANMTKAKDKVDEDIYNHYEGVARFWRAYHYVSRVNSFSDVPWVETYVQPSDTAILYGKRDDREFVFHKITEDLLFASKNCMNGKFKTDYRVVINKDVVNALAARFFLYEGTFRKNIKVNPATNQPWTNQYETPDQLIQYARDCAKEVIDNGGYKLISDYASLFTSPTLQKEEVIWGRTFLTDVNGRHNLTRYFHSSTLGQQYSGTKSLVRMYMNADGTPCTDAQAQSSILTEFNGRDPRLAATVLGPGRAILDASGKPANETIDFTFCKTGYQLVKWCIPNAANFQNSLDENSLPIVRYAEVLLIYAEAVCELNNGVLDEDTWNLTVGALRQRAGVANVYPGSAAYVPDAWLKDYYIRDLVNPGTSLTDYQLEIRRERVTELMLESGSRQSDLYRYGQVDLVARRYDGDGWAGIWLSADDVTKGFDFEGIHYTFEPAATGAVNSTNCYPYKPKASAVNTDWYLSEGDHGYLCYKYNLAWEAKKYCRPIPLSATNINPALGQNFGW